MNRRSFRFQRDAVSGSQARGDGTLSFGLDGAGKRVRHGSMHHDEVRGIFHRAHKLV